MKIALFLISFFIVAKSVAQNIPEYVFSGGKAVVGKNVFQSDVGVNAARIQSMDIQSIDNYQFAQYVNLKYGIATKGHISLNYNYSTTVAYVSEAVIRNNIANNLNLSYKHLFWSNISLQTTVGVNEFLTKLNELESYSYQIQAIAEHALTSNLTWQNNLGFSSSFIFKNFVVNYLTGLTYSFDQPFDLIFEIYGNGNEQTQRLYSNIGFGYYFSKDFMSEIYLGHGFLDSETDLFASVNLYYRLKPKSVKN